MTLDSITIDFEITWDVAVKCLTDTFYNQDAKGRLERIQALTPPQVEGMIEQALKCHGTLGNEWRSCRIRVNMNIILRNSCFLSFTLFLVIPVVLFWCSFE